MEQIPVPSGFQACLLLIPLRGQEACQKQAAVGHRERSAIIMKISADKTVGSAQHALSITEIKRILKAIPAEWLDGLSRTHLSNSSESAPRAFFDRFHKTLTIHSCGSTPLETLKIILSELATVHLGYTTRHWHRLSATEKSKIKKITQPFVDELLPIVTSKRNRFIQVSTPAFQRVI